MLRYKMRGTTALICLAALATPAAAQEDSLGTLFLTFGKRDIQTGTGTASTVVDRSEIEDRQANTVAQLIDSVPGVTLVNGTTPQGSGINIRGFGANTTFGTDQKIAILIDDATVGSEEIYRIGTQLFTDPFLYRRVEVLRGTIGSFEYGSGIVGGVVKMETKDASDFTKGVTGFKVGQTIQGSSNGSGVVSSSTLAWQPSERAEFLANYTYRTQKDLKDGSDAVIGNSAFTTPSGLIKAKLTFGDADEHTATFSYTRTLADDKDVPYDTFNTTGGAFGNVDRVTDTSQAAFQYRYNPSDLDTVDLSATLSYADQKIDYSYVPGSSFLEGTPSFGFLQNTVNANQRYQTTKLTLKNVAKFETGALSHELRAGVELIRKERADNPTAAPGGTDNRQAIFLIDKISSGGFTFTPALRFERSKVTSAGNFGTFENSALMGGAALAYKWESGFSVFASASYTEGLPIIDDLGSTPAAISKMNTSEKSTTYEVGASYGGSDVFTAGDNFSIKGNFYKTTLSDITSYTAPRSVTALLDKVETQGFELETSYGLSSGLYFDLNGHFGTGTEVYADGTSDTWRNTAASTVGLTVGKKWNDMLDLSWEVARSSKNRDSSGAALADFTVHNLRATYKPQAGVLEGTEVRFGIENALNLDYTSHLSSATRKAPGRSVSLTISALF